jgi:hypothetical protein
MTTDKALATALGAAQSKTVWAALVIAAVPQFWEAVLPLVTLAFGEPTAGKVGAAIGAVMVILRMLTSKPLHAKADPNA